MSGCARNAGLEGRRSSCLRAASYARAGLLALWLVLSSATAPVALEIELDYRFDRTGFFDDPARRALLERAARLYTDELSDSLAAIEGEHWEAVFPDPSTGRVLSLPAPVVPRDRLVVFVGARPMRDRGELAVAGPGYWKLSCFSFFPKVGCIAEALRRDDFFWASRVRPLTFEILFRSSEAARRYPPSDFAPWGGHLAFASDASWWFGEEGPVPSDRFDFLTSAAHELGHVLGVGTAESWASAVSGRRFVGTEAVEQAMGEVLLAEDYAHLADGTASHRDGLPAAALFARFQKKGERRLPTELDYALLRDVGWRRSEPPGDGEPVSPYGGQRLAGDLDGNGRVEARDADLLAGALLYDAHTDWNTEAGDVWRRQGGFGPDGRVDTHDAGRDLAMLATAVAVAETIAESGDCSWQPRPGYEFERHSVTLLGLRARETPGGGCRYETNPTAGDADLDGDVDRTDYLFAVGVAWARADPHGWSAEAGDVWPLDEGGNALGDGLLDARDLALLRASLESPDGDRDGLLDEDENGLNEFAWMNFVGRPQHGPLTRWTGACLSNLEELLENGVVAYLGRNMEILIEFCSRGGTPWSLALEIPPEEIATRVDLPAVRGPETVSIPMPRESDAAPPTGGRLLPLQAGSPGGTPAPAPPAASGALPAQSGWSAADPPLEAHRDTRALSEAPLPSPPLAVARAVRANDPVPDTPAVGAPAPPVDPPSWREWHERLAAFIAKVLSSLVALLEQLLPG